MGSAQTLITCSHRDSNGGLMTLYEERRRDVEMVCEEDFDSASVGLSEGRTEVLTWISFVIKSMSSFLVRSSMFNLARLLRTSNLKGPIIRYRSLTRCSQTEPSLTTISKPRLRPSDLVHISTQRSIYGSDTGVSYSTSTTRSTFPKMVPRKIIIDTDPVRYPPPPIRNPIDSHLFPGRRRHTSHTPRLRRPPLRTRDPAHLRHLRQHRRPKLSPQRRIPLLPHREGDRVAAERWT